MLSTAVMLLALSAAGPRENVASDVRERLQVSRETADDLAGRILRIGSQPMTIGSPAAVEGMELLDALDMARGRPPFLCMRALEDLEKLRSASDSGNPRDALAAVDRFLGCRERARLIMIEFAGTGSAASGQYLAMQADREDPSVKSFTKAIGDKKDFLGLNLGAAVGFAWPTKWKGRVAEAKVVGGKVVVTKRSSAAEPRVIWESHYFRGLGERLGAGVYLGIVTSRDEVFSGVSMGAMAGIRGDGTSQGFSVGFGPLLEADVKYLPRGLTEGSLVPEGVETVELVSKPAWSWVLFAARTF